MRLNSYMVSYDLIKRKDYPELWGVLRSYNYWHCLGSTWIIKTNETAAQLFNKLRAHIDDDDRLIVNRLWRESNWTLSFSDECQNWLRNNL